ncbi:MAG: lysophospholipid acyltransferase family protein [Proteobacteria bacterium]|nr:lysophospholipid acyltransferase family protein [Pseudomonadota bacterium]
MFRVLRPAAMFIVLFTGVVLTIMVYPFRFIGINMDYYTMSLWAKITLWIYKIKIVRLGKRSKQPAIIVTNHISYWDILTISASFKAFFVSKASVKHWPLIGWGARFARTIFIVREKTMSAVDVLNREAVKLIHTGNSVVMFAEGTTSINPCLPFKNGAFHMSKQTNSPIKPIAVYYSRMDFIRWIDDESFVPHLLNMTKIPASVCYIYELPLMYPADFRTVNEMKEKCQRLVQEKIDYIKKDLVREK